MRSAAVEGVRCRYEPNPEGSLKSPAGETAGAYCYSITCLRRRGLTGGTYQAKVTSIHGRYPIQRFEYGVDRAYQRANLVDKSWSASAATPETRSCLPALQQATVGYCSGESRPSIAGLSWQRTAAPRDTATRKGAPRSHSCALRAVIAPASLPLRAAARPWRRQGIVALLGHSSFQLRLFLEFPTSTIAGTVLPIEKRSISRCWTTAERRPC